MSKLWKILYNKALNLFPNDPNTATLNGTWVDQPKIQITYHDVGKGNSQCSAAIGELLP